MYILNVLVFFSVCVRLHNLCFKNNKSDYVVRIVVGGLGGVDMILFILYHLYLIVLTLRLLHVIFKI